MTDSITDPISLIPLGANVSIDWVRPSAGGASSIWRLQDDPSNSQAITIAAPHGWESTLIANGNYVPALRVFLPTTGTTNPATLYQPGGSIIIGSMGGSLVWTDANANARKNGGVELVYDAGIALWRTVSCWGTWCPNSGAL